VLRASCHACSHKAIITPATLQQGRPGFTRLMVLRRGDVDPRLAMSLERQLRCRMDKEIEVFETTAGQVTDVLKRGRACSILLSS
jgi:hypothetical protein